MPGSDRLAPPSRRTASLAPAQDLHRECPRPDAFERTEQLVETGSWEWNVATDRLLWSDNMFRLLGLEPGAVLPTPDYVIGRTHPDDRERVAAVVAAARLDASSPDVIFRVIWPTARSVSFTAPRQSSPNRKAVPHGWSVPSRTSPSSPTHSARRLNR
jgi:hypothetical protein